MSIVIVPNTLRDAIYAKLDVEIQKNPDALKDREVLYQKLLEYYNENGIIPEFNLFLCKPL